MLVACEFASLPIYEMEMPAGHVTISLVSATTSSANCTCTAKPVQGHRYKIGHSNFPPLFLSPIFPPNFNFVLVGVH